MFEFAFINELHGIAGLVLALHALLAIWVGLARRPPWPWRFLILLGVIAMWRRIEGRDVIIYLLLQSGVISGTLLVVREAWPRLWRWFRSRRSGLAVAEVHSNRIQLTLKEMFVATALLAVAFALARAELDHLRPDMRWYKLSLPLASTCTIALLATLAAFARGHWAWRTFTVSYFVANVAGISVDASSMGYEWIEGDPSLDFFRMPELEYLAVISYSLVLFGVLLLWRGRLASSVFVARGARFSLIGLSVLTAVPLGYVYWQMAIHLPIPPRPEVKVNGYERLAEIGAPLKDIEIPYEDDNYDEYPVAIAGKRWDDTLDEYVDLSPEEQAQLVKRDVLLDRFVSQHSTVVADVQAAVKYPSFVPVDYFDEAQELPERWRLMRLARTLTAFGRHAEQRGRIAYALDRYLDVIKVGHAVSQDGLLVDRLIGMGLEGMGGARLRGLRRKLAIQQQRTLLTQLLAWDAQREPLELCQHRERVWSSNSSGCRARLFYLFEFNSMWEPVFTSIEGAEDDLKAKSRLLFTTLALEIYREENGRLPKSLDELVPDLLPEVPQDPYGSGALAYRRLEDGKYRLYSVGSNRIDDGGIVATFDGDTLQPEEAASMSLTKETYGEPDEGDLFLDQDDWFRGTDTGPIVPLTTEQRAEIEAAQTTIADEADQVDDEEGDEP